MTSTRMSLGGTAVVVVAYAWWAARLETFSTGSTVAVVGGGAAVMAGGTWRRLRGRPGQTLREGARPQRPGLALWFVLLTALAVWQTQAFVQSPREDHPTISSLANTALETEAARAGACAGWLVGAYRIGRREATP